MNDSPSLFDSLTGGQPIQGEVTVKIDLPTIAILGTTIFIVIIAAGAITKRL